MSYEEIDKAAYGTDVFTNGADGRYAKPKSSTETSTKKKRAPKPAATTNDETTEQTLENGHTDEVVKTKKKTRKTDQTNGIEHENETSQVAHEGENQTVAKPKKKRAPKVESNNENIDPIPTTSSTAEAVAEEPVKKKKSKAPKPALTEDDFHMIDSAPINELEPSVDAPVKVKKSKKNKAPKVSPEHQTETFDDVQINDSNNDKLNSEFNDLQTGDGFYDPSAENQTENQQTADAVVQSEYEAAIKNAYAGLAAKINFTQYVGDDKWCILHLPKSARTDQKSIMRKMLPGNRDDKSDRKAASKKTNAQKGGFLNRIRTGVNTLVKDENNLIFGEQSKFDVGYFDEDEEIDTDNLHRYAQQLRELEDADREVNPEYLVLSDGKTVFGVHETDDSGNMKLAKRKPIYDRFGDQKPDDIETSQKKKILSRLRHPFSRSKDKDGKGSNSPNPSNGGTPDHNGKQRARKSTGKSTDDMQGMTNNEPLVD